MVIWADLMFLTSVGEVDSRVRPRPSLSGVVSPGKHDQRQWTPAARPGVIGRAGSRVYLLPFLPLIPEPDFKSHCATAA